MSARRVATRAVDELATSLAAHGARHARVAFVLGSGLGAFADRLDGARAIAFDALPGMPRTSVQGHAGRVVLGSIDGVEVLVQQGRVHLYEGWSAATVTRSVRAYAKLGIEALVLTNAAGGLVPGWPVPTLMRVTDHLNLQGRTPLFMSERGLGNPYDERAGVALDATAARLGIGLRRGVYVGLLGPSYETPAEIQYLMRSGGHAVGMSTVCEAQAGYVTGMRVAAVSCISNAGAGLGAGALDHQEVVEAGRVMADSFGQLLAASVAPILAERAPSDLRLDSQPGGQRDAT
ncbi:MAG: purine-nucleoside phosphorylase [Planctomycetota bacterium]